VPRFDPYVIDDHSLYENIQEMVRRVDVIDGDVLTNEEVAQIVWLSDKGVPLGVADLDSSSDLTWFSLDLDKLVVVDSSHFTFDGDVTGYFKANRNIRFNELSIVGVKSSEYDEVEGYTEVEVYTVEGEGVPLVATKMEGSRLPPGMAGSSLPPVNDPVDNGKFLSIAGGLPSWVEKPNSLPDIELEDESKILSILGGVAVWSEAPNPVPDVEELDEGKALAVVDGIVVWADPLEELGIGTGLFEFDVDGNLTPKGRQELYSELVLGSGHFEFDVDGDIMLKADGTYSVGSTLPPSTEEDNYKALHLINGSPVWRHLSEMPATTEESGTVELATPAEVLAGEDTERAVTPAGFKAGIEASYPTLDSDRIYDGGNLETKFAAEIAEHTDVWAWVKARAQAGNFTGLHVGDYVQFTVGSDTVQAQIAGMDTYYRTGDSTQIGHHIDFISRDCLTETYQWNTTNINNGDETNAAPWMVSALKAILDGLVTSLPVGLQSVVVTKQAFIETRYTSGSTLADSTSRAWNDMGKLWVPSEFEVFGTIVWGTRGYSQNGGVQYPIFGSSWKNRIKGSGHNGERTGWWLSSVYSGNSTNCCCINTDGRPHYNSASTARGVPLCFRIS